MSCSREAAYQKPATSNQIKDVVSSISGELGTFHSRSTLHHHFILDKRKPLRGAAVFFCPARNVIPAEVVDYMRALRRPMAAKPRRPAPMSSMVDGSGTTLVKGSVEIVKEKPKVVESLSGVAKPSVPSGTPAKPA